MSLLHEDAFVDGRWITAAARFDLTDPARGTVVGRVDDCTATEAAAAIDAAWAASAPWGARHAGERAALLKS